MEEIQINKKKNIFLRTRDAFKHHRFGVLCYLVSKWRKEYKIKKIGLSIGEKSRIDFPIDVRSPENIIVGKNCVIGPNAFLVASPNAKILIGDDVLLAPNVHINTTMHRYEDPNTPIRLQGGIEKDIVIGKDVWLGIGVIILQGVSIGDGSVIGAGSVVKKDIPPFSVAAGVPAKIIKKREPKTE